MSEIAWAAGFFDGEGCTTVTCRRTGRTKGYKRISLDIAQLDTEVLERFQRAVGIGKVRGPYGKKTGYYYRYTASGIEEVRATIERIWPWLSSIKQNQAFDKLVEIEEFDSRERKTPGPKPKLDRGQVEDVKKLARLGLGTAALAFMFDVSVATIWGIKKEIRRYAQK